MSKRQTKGRDPDVQHYRHGSSDVILVSSKPRLLLSPHSASTLYVDEGISSPLRPASSRSNHFLNALEPTTKSSVREATGDISNSNLTVTVIPTGEMTS